MKTTLCSLTIAIAAMTLSSCGGAGNGHGGSNGMFGKIPQTIEKYDSEKKALNAGMTESNYKKNLAKIDELKAETSEKLEKEALNLNGKELAVTVDENNLKIATPLTLVYKNVFSNMQAVEFGLDGKLVAAADIKLDIAPSDLKGREMLGGKTTVVTAKLPVHIEFLDDQATVVDTRTIGYLVADNNGNEAVVKTGSAVDFAICSIPVSDKFINVKSARVVIDPSKGLTSETMPQ